MQEIGTTAFRLPQVIASEIGGLSLGPLLASATGTTTCAVGVPEPRFYLKFGPAKGPNPVAADAERLVWLAAHNAPAPRLVARCLVGDIDYLLMTALPGRTAATLLTGATNPGVIEAIAVLLRDIHRLPTSCPFKASAQDLLAQAQQRLNRGFVDAADFEAEYRSSSPHTLLTHLCDTCPQDDVPVVAHDDATLDNILFAASRVSGVVDVGRLGVCDRHRDLAIMERSLRNRVSTAASDAFLDAYGRERVDPERLAWYRLLDEFF